MFTSTNLLARIDPHLPMFASFIQAGFECSTQKLRDGRRLDVIASTRHDEFVRQDYDRLRNMGILTAREGLRWHLIEKVRGVYDFSSVLPMIEAAQRANIQVIWDLFHFGWPDHLSLLYPGWSEAFSDFSFEFARLWKREAGTRAFMAPMNEISFFAWGAGDLGFLNPFLQYSGPAVKANLVRAGIQSAAAIRSELPNVVIVSPEPVIHVVGDPQSPGDMRHAEDYRQSMFETWDMFQGLSRPELGGSKSTLNVLGINFYDRNQRWNYGKVIHRGEPEYRPFHRILEEVYRHYRLPLLISETGTEGEERPEWFAYIASEVRIALELGVPVHGICLYPILNHPGWDDDRHCMNGLWDYAEHDGSRPVYEPLAVEIEKQEVLRNEMIQEALI